MSKQGYDVNEGSDESPEAEGSIGRRQVLKRGAAGAAAVWAVPVIVTLAASPAGATSDPPTTGTTGGTQPPEQPTTQGTQPPEQPTTQGTQPPEQPTTQGTQPTSTTAATTGATTSSTSGPVEQEARAAQVPAPTTTRPSGTAVGVGTQAGANTPGGLAFTGAEIGGLVVLGAGAVALGTAAVWTAKQRDDDEASTPAEG